MAKMKSVLEAYKLVQSGEWSVLDFSAWVSEVMLLAQKEVK
jgi:hypothetical protein